MGWVAMFSTFLFSPFERHKETYGRKENSPINHGHRYILLAHFPASFLNHKAMPTTDTKSIHPMENHHKLNSLALQKFPKIMEAKKTLALLIRTLSAISICFSFILIPDIV